MMKKKRSHATVCVVLGGKTVVEVIYICKSYLSYFCAFSEDLCYINFSLLNSPVIPVFIIADVPDWRSDGENEATILHWTLWEIHYTPTAPKCSDR